MEMFNYINNYGKNIYICPRAENDKYILIKNNYKAGTYLLSEIINDGAEIVTIDELNIDNKEVFEKMMKEYYLIHVADITGEVTDGNYSLYCFEVEDVLNDFRITYDDNILKHVEIRKEDKSFEGFYLYLNEEQLKKAKNIIVNNAIEEFEEGFREIAGSQEEKVARTFVEFYFDGQGLDIHLVLAYENEYKEADKEYADYPGDYGTRICLKNDNYLRCVVLSLSTNNVVEANLFLDEIVNDIWTGLSKKEPAMDVISDYRVVEPLSYD